MWRREEGFIRDLDNRELAQPDIPPRAALTSLLAEIYDFYVGK